MLGSVLQGLRVIDLTQNVAGPYCTQVLADLGAEVIKIERPGSGDDARAWRPPEIGGMGTGFAALNRSKKSVALDLDRPEGQRIVAQLAAGADVLVHSLKPGSAEARGLGEEPLRAANPRLVYCAISAFGEAGPMRGLPGYDPLMQAFTGIMSVTGHEGDEPARVGVSLIDLGTGMWAAMAVLAALLQRATTGQGLRVGASLLETEARDWSNRRISCSPDASVVSMNGATPAWSAMPMLTTQFTGSSMFASPGVGQPITKSASLSSVSDPSGHRLRLRPSCSLVSSAVVPVPSV